MIYIDIPEKAKVYHEVFLTEDYDRRKSLKSKIITVRSYHLERQCYCISSEGKLKKECSHKMTDQIRECFVKVFDFILNKFKDIVIGDLETLFSIHQEYEQLIELLFKNGKTFKSVDYQKGFY